MSSFERGSSWATSSHAVQTETKEFSVPRFSFCRSVTSISVTCFLAGLWFVICDFSSSTYFVSCPFMSYRVRSYGTQIETVVASRHRLCGAGCRQERAGGSRPKLAMWPHDSPQTSTNHWQFHTTFTRHYIYIYTHFICIYTLHTIYVHIYIY